MKAKQPFFWRRLFLLAVLGVGTSLVSPAADLAAFSGAWTLDRGALDPKAQTETEWQCPPVLRVGEFRPPATPEEVPSIDVSASWPDWDTYRAVPQLKRVSYLFPSINREWQIVDEGGVRHYEAVRFDGRVLSATSEATTGWPAGLDRELELSSPQALVFRHWSRRQDSYGKITELHSVCPYRPLPAASPFLCQYYSEVVAYHHKSIRPSLAVRYVTDVAVSDLNDWKLSFYHPILFPGRIYLVTMPVNPAAGATNEARVVEQDAYTHEVLSDRRVDLAASAGDLGIHFDYYDQEGSTLRSSAWCSRLE